MFYTLIELSIFIHHFHFYSLIYTFHTIPSQIRLDKKWCHLLSTFQWHLRNSDIVVPYNSKLYEQAMTKEGSLCFLFSDGSLWFHVEVRHFGFCEGCNSFWVFRCLGIWFRKVINVFCFRTKEKETFQLII